MRVVHKIADPLAFYLNAMLDRYIPSYSACLKFEQEEESELLWQDLFKRINSENVHVTCQNDNNEEITWTIDQKIKIRVKKIYKQSIQDSTKVWSWVSSLCLGAQVICFLGGVAILARGAQQKWLLQRYPYQAMAALVVEWANISIFLTAKNVANHANIKKHAGSTLGNAVTSLPQQVDAIRKEILSAIYDNKLIDLKLMQMHTCMFLNPKVYIEDIFTKKEIECLE